MRSSRSGATIGGILLTLIAIAVAIFLPDLSGTKSSDTPTALPPIVDNSGGINNPTTPNDFPLIAVKPQPQEITFLGCPPEGDGGDSIQNPLKNRVDEGNYTLVSFDSINTLTWPTSVEKNDRANWSSADTAAISKYEGTPVRVEGYIARATESGPESTNCHASASLLRH